MSEVNKMMLEDSKDLLDNVEVNTIASECVKLKQKEERKIFIDLDMRH